MERVEPIQAIRKILPVRKAMPDYFDFETQYLPRQKRQFRAKKSTKNSSKPEPDKQQHSIVDGVGDRVDYKV
ncbi:hypothetical protein [Sporomusa silvacetica]|uniref:hypothetical protein n=1 Tax=Sporomusa silvacetica TaxID=55504 RepID=UPI000B99EACA|nr:hypothetical protein [Sporomusa silvacetica]